MTLGDCLRCKNLFVVEGPYIHFCRACQIGHLRECQTILANHDFQKPSDAKKPPTATSPSVSTSPGLKKTSGQP